MGTRPLGIARSCRLLKDGVPNVGARLRTGDMVGLVDTDDVGDAGAGTEGSLGEVGLTQTWSARCRMSMSTAQDEHLIVGRLLIRSMACRCVGAGFCLSDGRLIRGSSATTRRWQGSFVVQRGGVEECSKSPRRRYTSRSNPRQPRAVSMPGMGGTLAVSGETTSHWCRIRLDWRMGAGKWASVSALAPTPVFGPTR